MEIPVLFGAFYGLRRSEIVGLRWESNRLTLRMMFLLSTTPLLPLTLTANMLFMHQIPQKQSQI